MAKDNKTETKSEAGPNLEALAALEQSTATAQPPTNPEPEQAVNLSRMAALEAELKSALERIGELESEVDGQTGLKCRPGAKPFLGDGGGYEFVVTPKYTSEKLSHLKPMKVRCCDESEALRWYCEANENAPGSGRALDTVTPGLQLIAQCIDERRAQAILLQKQIAALRTKIERNMPLTDQDHELLERYESKVMNY